jgi:hypothetical protein
MTIMGRDIVAAGSRNSRAPRGEAGTVHYLVRAFFDPYHRGMSMAYRVYARGGREALRALYREPPVWNTRDAMFSEEWMKEPRGAADVKPPDLEETLGPDWKRTYGEVSGALTLHVMFEDQRALADAIARAWDGDRFGLWERGEEAFVAGVLVFATERAASLFGKQLERAYRTRWNRGREVDEHAALGTHLSAGADHLLLEVRGKSAVFCRGRLPMGPARIVEALWKSEVEAAGPLKKP